jgi:glutathione S-transferase
MTKAVVRPAVAHVPGTWRLLYFDAPNRGEQIRTLFGVAAVAFHDVRCAPYPDGLNPYKSAAMGDDSPLKGTDKCPAITAPDGTSMVETSDIMRYVGQQVGLAPAAGSADDTKATEMCLLAQTILDTTWYPLLMHMAVKDVFANGLGFGTQYLVPRLMFGKLAASGGPFVLGSKICFADVSLFDTLSKALDLEVFDQAALLAEHPKCSMLLKEVQVKAAPWLAKTKSDHMAVKKTIVEYLSSTNTPFPWAKVRTDGTTKAEVWEPPK